jgi:hypothetical protein
MDVAQILEPPQVRPQAAQRMASAYGLVMQSRRLMLRSALRREKRGDPQPSGRTDQLRGQVEQATQQHFRWLLASSRPEPDGYRRAALRLLVELGERALEDLRIGARTALPDDRWQLLNVDLPCLTAMVEGCRTGLRPALVKG